MILATGDDYEYPHIDWHCKKCGEVYRYAGYPPETRCTNGHGHGWRPDPEQVNEYIDLLESLNSGDGIVIAGDGPAALMGPIEAQGFEYGTSFIITESIDSPRRKLRWERDEDDPTLEWCNLDREHEIYDDVHHVETVEIRTLQTGTDRTAMEGKEEE